MTDKLRDDLAEVVRLQSLMGWSEMNPYLTDAFIRTHHAQIQRNAEDAARVDWLARICKTSTCDMSGQHPWNAMTHKLRNLRGPTFRDAIDKAMRANGGEKPKCS